MVGMEGVHDTASRSSPLRPAAPVSPVWEGKVRLKLRPRKEPWGPSMWTWGTAGVLEEVTAQQEGLGWTLTTFIGLCASLGKSLCLSEP